MTGDTQYGALAPTVLARLVPVGLHHRSRGSEGGLADLIRDADIALYRAQRDGRGRARVFQPSAEPTT